MTEKKEKKIIPHQKIEGSSEAEESMLNDMRIILNTKEGRRVFWMLLARCKTFGSIMETNAKVYYNAGQQDIGHFLLAQITKADDNLFLQMMRESKQGEMTYE